ncbi:uncharacterized protein [Paralichthys olivaceus]|uniref:uncharacterized protein isoform X2 n=1 Tax=Paralichthys olivaceus TaxID=8255 RepID=UPI0037509508
MMTEIRWIKVFLFLMLTPPFSGQYLSSIIVREGDDVTLPCKNVIPGQNKCDGTDWFSDLNGSGNVVDLVRRGSISKAIKDKNRVSVNENCSLVIKNVTAADNRRYDCRQLKSEQDHLVHLSVVQVTESIVNDELVFSCSVSTYGYGHRVKCLYKDPNVTNDVVDWRTSQCSLIVSPYLKRRPNYRELFTCEVTDGYFKIVERFTLSSQPSGDEVTTATVTRTTETDTTASDQTPQRWWLYVAVAAGLAAFLITTVAVIRLKRNKGNKTQMEENSGQRLNPAETQSGPETSWDKADPGDDVCYTSVIYIKKSNREDRFPSQVRVRDDSDAMTYSTAKSYSSAGASSDVYAAVNKPKANRDHSRVFIRPHLST